MLAARVNPTSQTSAAAPAKPSNRFFRTLLSELNPLQYLPVVGTIYRAMTGDTIPEAARFAGSLVVSGLTGGPLGVAVNVGTTVLEHALGLDPERLGARLLADLGIGTGRRRRGRLCGWLGRVRAWGRRCPGPGLSWRHMGCGAMQQAR